MDNLTIFHSYNWRIFLPLLFSRKLIHNGHLSLKNSCDCERCSFSFLGFTRGLSSLGLCV
jgi:hypothetical protein